MARFTRMDTTLALITLVLLLSASSAPTSQAARFLLPQEDSLFLAALPKGTVPSSTPTKKGHALLVDQKLTARRHLVESVPSPGVGH